MRAHSRKGLREVCAALSIHLYESTHSLVRRTSVPNQLELDLGGSARAAARVAYGYSALYKSGAFYECVRQRYSSLH